MKKRLMALLMALTLIVLCGCSEKSGGTATSLSFSAATELSELEKLDGKTVTIVGYMATLSPVSGEYIYLMNLPYQSCPFCVPNTTQLANTMAVYAKKGNTFEFTDQAIRVTGKMEFSDYVDEYGYTYNYRIVDATFEEIDLSSVSEEYALWQTIAADGIVADINTMFDYLYFVCQWTEYQFEVDGQTVWMYPGDVTNYLEDDGPYGYATMASEDYFPSLISRIDAISSTELEDLKQIVNDAKEVEQYALDQLNEGNYAYDEANDRFILNNAEELYNRWYEVYARFSQWLTKWKV